MEPRGGENSELYQFMGLPAGPESGSSCPGGRPELPVQSRPGVPVAGLPAVSFKYLKYK